MTEPRRAKRAREPKAQAPQLDLRLLNDALSLHARRFYDDELPAGASDRAFTAFDASTLDEYTRLWALSAWQRRTLDEYRSQVGFTEFLMELTTFGASFDILSVAVRVVRDEARHVELCRRLVVALGGSSVIPGAPQWTRSDATRPLLERVLSTTIGSLCIGETLSAALLGATHKVTTLPIAREVTRVLAADESIHSQFGWLLLGALWPHTPAKTRKVMEGEISAILDYAREVCLEGVDEPPPAVRNSAGELLPAERRKVFERALEHDVLRRFSALKIKART